MSERGIIMSGEKLKNFERAFSNGTGGSRRTCECGKTYFDSVSRIYSWDEGELEQLQKTAIALDYAPGDIGFEGKEYVDACDCWRERAERIMLFLDSHAYKIAEYLKAEKERKLADAKASPTIK